MSLTWINGKYLDDSKACLHISDLAIQRGYGIFDFFCINRPRPYYLLETDTRPEPDRTTSTIPFMLSSYLDRFFESAHGLHLKIPVDKTELRKVIMEFIKKNQLRNHGIKLILTGGYSEDGFTPIKPNLIIRAHQIKQLPAEKYRTGYKVMTCEFQRSTPEFKSLDYRHAIALIPQLLQKGLDDVLYYKNSIVTEFPRSNFFMVDQDNRLITPANNILKGITRKALLQVASEYCEVEERDIFTDELLIAREVFLTSSTKLIMPVTEIDGHPVGKGTPGPVTRRLAEMLDQLPADFEFLP